MSADINTTAAAIEAFVVGYIAAGVAPKEVHVRPSGDDVDLIKVWIDLGSAKVDVQAWARDCEVAIKENVVDAKSFQLAVRVESELTA